MKMIISIWMIDEIGYRDCKSVLRIKLKRIFYKFFYENDILKPFRILKLKIYIKINIVRFFPRIFIFQFILYMQVNYNINYYIFKRGYIYNKLWLHHLKKTY